MERDNNGITIIGLGPGDPSLITRQAWQVLLNIDEVYLRTKHHPAVAGLPEHLELNSFDHYYTSKENFSQVYSHIIEEILTLGRRPQGVVYAVPGHPFIAEATCTEIYHRAVDVGINIRVIEGISFIDSTLTALGIDPFPQLSIVDALEIAAKHTPGFPPDYPALIGQLHSRQVASDVKLTLMEVYPDEHPVKLIHNAGTDQLIIEDLPLFQIDQTSEIGMLTTLFISPLEDGNSFESFQEIIAHLRAPDGCPWDREQTHLSLRSNLLEETYEALSALDEENPQAMQEEFGDLLLQIVLHAQIASELGDFNMNTLIKGIFDKIIRRHPHVFSDVEINNVEQVLVNWERFKAEERDIDGPVELNLLNGVPNDLPALTQSEQYQERVTRTGFIWPDLQSLVNTINQDIGVITNPQNDVDLELSFGDLMFTMTSLARHYDVDAESALRQANTRFRNRFVRLENLLTERGGKIEDLTHDEFTTLWEFVKSVDH